MAADGPIYESRKRVTTKDPQPLLPSSTAKGGCRTLRVPRRKSNGVPPSLPGKRDGWGGEHKPSPQQMRRSPHAGTVEEKASTPFNQQGWRVPKTSADAITSSSPPVYRRRSKADFGGGGYREIPYLVYQFRKEHILGSLRSLKHYRVQTKKKTEFKSKDNVVRGPPSTTQETLDFGVCNFKCTGETVPDNGENMLR